MSKEKGIIRCWECSKKIKNTNYNCLDNRKFDRQLSKKEIKEIYNNGEHIKYK